MTALRRLVVATDLSARSDRAIARSVALSAETGAALTVVHVIDNELPARLADRQAADAEALIAEHLRSLPTQAAALDVKVIRGTDSEDIIAVAEDLKADLVVLGIHRNEPQRLVFTGTTAERVIRKGARPVLMVKDRCSGPYRQILVAIDFSIYSRRAVGFAVRMFPEADFRLVHAYDVPFKGFLSSTASSREVGRSHGQEMARLVDEELGALMASMQEQPVRCTPVLREGSVRQVIHDEIERQKPDLLVVGTHGRTGVAAALLGSVAQDLLGNPPCDVLAVKAW